MSWAAFFSSLMLNHVWQGLILVGLAAIALHIVSRASATSRHSTWFLVLLLLLGMPFFVLLPAAPDANVPGSVATLVTEESRTAEVPVITPGRPMISATAAGSASVQKLWPWAEIAISVWFVISLWQMLQLTVALRRARELRRGAWNVDNKTLARSEGLRKRFGIRRRIAVCWSKEIGSPQAQGVWKPVILLPHSWARGVEPNLLDHALAHELAHFKRGDPLVVWVQFMARILFGFNPAVWYAIHQMNRERESACDDWALRLGEPPRSYASSLVAVAESLIPGHGPELAVSCLRSRHHLSRRISHMLDRKKDHSTRPMGLVVGAIAAIAVTGVAFAAPNWPDLPTILASSTLDNNPDHIGGRWENSDREPRQSDDLLYAAWTGDVALATDFLAAGADPEKTYDRDPRTALIAAGRRGHWDVVELLLANGADVNHHARGDESVLMTAARRGNAEAVDFLLAAGADANDVIRGSGSPLIAASRSGNVGTVILLLDAGADPNRHVRGDEAPLYHAVVGGYEEVVVLLLDAGADPSVEYQGDGTPLMLAIKHGHNHIARVLMDAGANS